MGSHNPSLLLLSMMGNRWQRLETEDDITICESFLLSQKYSNIKVAMINKNDRLSK